MSEAFRLSRFGGIGDPAGQHPSDNNSKNDLAEVVPGGCSLK
jgi:hypothetical protein